MVASEHLDCDSALLKDTTLGQTREFNAQIQVLDIPNEIKTGYSPIGSELDLSIELDVWVVHDVHRVLTL